MVTGVALVGLQHGLLAGLVLAQLVGAGPDDLVVGEQLAGREDLLVDDGRGGAGQHLEEGGVRLVQVEDDRGVVGGLDRPVGQLGRVRVAAVGDRAEQHRGAHRVGDLDVALQRELDVGGRQVVAVGELQARLQRAGDRLRVVVLARLRGVTDRLVAAGGDRDQLLEDVVLHVPRAEVVGTSRVHRRDALGRAQDPALTLAAAAAVVATGRVVAASGERRDQDAGTGQRQ